MGVEGALGHDPQVCNFSTESGLGGGTSEAFKSGMWHVSHSIPRPLHYPPFYYL